MDTASTTESPRVFWRRRAYPTLERIYGLDLRSLALFRVAMALIYLGDFALRLKDVLPHYTDFGVLPRHALLQQFANPAQISIFFISGNTFVITSLMVIAMVFGLAMLFGFRTRAAIFLCWFMAVSIQNRNPMVLQGGDVLFRMLLFWAMFLPLGAYWSFDSGLDNAHEPRPDRVFNFASVGLMLQICMVYWLAYSLKSGPEWHREGNAVWYALSIQQMGTATGGLMLHFPHLLRFLTYFTLAVELLAPVFLLVPVYSGPWRATAVLMLAALQLSFGWFIRLGHFPFIGSSMMISMLPTWFWEYVRPNAPRKKPQPIHVYYDEGCAFCLKSVMVLRSIAFPPQAVIAPAQATPDVHRDMVEHKSWVVVDPSGRRHYKADAMRLLLEHSLVWRPVAWLLRFPVVLRAADTLYEFVERHRTPLSRWSSFFKFRPLRFGLHPLLNTFAAFMLLMVILWNLTAIHPLEFRSPFWHIMQFTRADQRWDMFSPGPLRDDGWYVIDGTLHDGRHVDVFAGGNRPVSFATKTREQIAGQYPDERWRKYYMNMYLKDFVDYRIWYGRYLCRNWNVGKPFRNPSQLDSFDIYFMMRTNAPPGVEQPPYQKLMVHHHQCFDQL